MLDGAANPGRPIVFDAYIWRR